MTFSSFKLQRLAIPGRSKHMLVRLLELFIPRSTNSTRFIAYTFERQHNSEATKENSFLFDDEFFRCAKRHMLLCVFF